VSDWDLVLRGARVIDRKSGLELEAGVSPALRLLTRGGGQSSGPISLGQALAKCSLEPARLLEDRVPTMRRKGPAAGGPGRRRGGVRPGNDHRPASYSDSTRRRLGSGMSWSTALSWYATATSRPTPGPGAPSAPTRAEPGWAVVPGTAFERS
jgi:hypothetical protein